MKMLIVYTSKTGSTKQYSEWLHEEFPESDLKNIEDNTLDLENYDFIIAASPVIGGQFIISDLLSANVDKLKNKTVFLMGVGSVPQDEKWSKTSYNHIPENVRNELDGYIKLPGITKEPKGFEKILFRFILGVDQKKLVIQDEVKRKDLQPVIDWIKSKI